MPSAPSALSPVHDGSRRSLKNSLRIPENSYSLTDVLGSNALWLTTGVVLGQWPMKEAEWGTCVDLADRATMRAANISPDTGHWASRFECDGQ
jgi:hypothetical protein